MMESNQTAENLENVADTQLEDQEEKQQTENNVLRSVLEDWDDLNKDFLQLQVSLCVYFGFTDKPVSTTVPFRWITCFGDLVSTTFICHSEYL